MNKISLNAINGLILALSNKASHAELAEAISELELAKASHADLAEAISELNLAIALELSDKVDTAELNAAIDAVIGGAPGALDTLQELAAALGDDANFAATVTANLALKAPKASPSFTGRGTFYNTGAATNQPYHTVEVRAPSATGDANVVGYTFHIESQYARALHMRHDGYIGMTDWTWYVDPTGNMTAAANVSAYSDPELKENIQRIANPLDKLQTLDGVHFTWNNKTTLVGKPGQVDVGVLADQVQAVLPEAVGYSISDEANDGKQWRTVDYSKLIPLLIESIKELRSEVNELKGKLAE